MDQYQVTGMSCAACSARVEKAVSAVPGVTGCTVSLLTNSMSVEGSAPAFEVIRAVESAGYGASLRGGPSAAGAPAAGEDLLKDTESPRLVRRLAASVLILLALMYLSMGHMMWGWPVPGPFENHVVLGLTELLLAAAVMLINARFFTGGVRALLQRSPDMDTLVALGSGAAFVYSVAGLFQMILAQGQGSHAEVMRLADDLYFESAAMIPALITVGKLLESVSKGRTTDALRSLMRLRPKTAVLLREGQEVTVPIEELKTGDRFAVRPGEHFPTDGVIEEGRCAADESALTGESIPVDKAPGDPVSAATVNTSGYVICRATRVGEDTTLSGIIRMVSDAAATKAPLARIADRVSAVFVPAVIVLGVLTVAGWLLAGREIGFAMGRGISVLVISCPCALGLATPVAVMVAHGVGAKNGILFKTAAALENIGRTQIMVLDKTGTVTAGQPAVTQILPAPGVSEKELLEKAAALEQFSEHPLARAVTGRAQEEALTLPVARDLTVLPGRGLTASVNGVRLFGGSAAYIGSFCAIPAGLSGRCGELAQQGQTPLYFAEEDRLLGAVAVADVIREDSTEAVARLKGLGVRTVLLTGDQEGTAAAVAHQAGISRVRAGVLPDGKAAEIARQKQYGKVTMVGDGINDAPALTAADLGMAIGAGTDVALDAADIVLVKSSLKDAAAAVRLGRAAIRNIYENLFWAFFYNAACIPLAMGLWGIALKPMYAAAAMSLSSLCVCLNALRLNRLDIYDASGDRPLRKPALPDGEEEEDRAETPGKDPGSGTPGSGAGERPAQEETAPDGGGEKEGSVMIKTMTIEGMMCPHCEARVKKALEAVPGVENAQVSHTAGTAVVTLSAPVDDAVLARAVQDQEYTVRAIG